MMESPADRLRRARVARFDSASKAARAFGRTPSTYTHHENGTRGITVEAAKRYAKAFNIPLGELIALGPSISASASASTIVVIGPVSIGVWKDKTLLEVNAKRSNISVVVPFLAGAMQRAVLISDESANRHISSGEYGIFTPVEAVDDTVVSDGALLLIERERDGLIEWSVRKVVLTTAGKATLVLPSTNPRYVETIEWPPTSKHKVKIIGVVVGKYSPFPDATPPSAASSAAE